VLHYRSRRTHAALLGHRHPTATSNEYHQPLSLASPIHGRWPLPPSALLDDIAQMLGLPGKLGMDGSKVWDAYQAGKLNEIRDYCETDVLNTYLVYLRFELLRGNLDQPGYEREVGRVRDLLKTEDRPHWRAFLEAWK
jgi:predicted PolB exonuclease-like 3'-5' exonuclease